MERINCLTVKRKSRLGAALVRDLFWLTHRNHENVKGLMFYKGLHKQMSQNVSVDLEDTSLSKRTDTNDGKDDSKRSLKGCVIFYQHHVCVMLYTLCGFLTHFELNQ